jgi:hypothetical protein
VGTRPPRDPKYLLSLALASVVILVGGWLIRPRATPAAPVALLTEVDLAQLARRDQRRSLDSMTSYFAGVADDVKSSVVRVPELSASGIVWSPQRVITTRVSGTAPVSVRLDAETRVAHPDRWGPNLPLATLTLRGEREWAPATPATVPPGPGDWVVAVWRSDDAAVFVTGTYLERAPLDCRFGMAQEIVASLPLTEKMAGGGLFDLDGHLLALILPCGERVAALASTSIAGLLAQDATIPESIDARYGLVVSPRTPEEAPYFAGADGVLVREVVREQSGDLAGFVAGDLIVAVNGNAVSSVEDLAPVLTSPAEITVRRAFRRVVLALTGLTSEVRRGTPSADAGLVWESAPRSFAVDGVVAESRAARGAIEPGDRIVRIDYVQPRSLENVERLLRARADSPVLLEIERGDRRLVRWLPPEDARE